MRGNLLCSELFWHVMVVRGLLVVRFVVLCSLKCFVVHLSMRFDLIQHLSKLADARVE